MKRNLEHGIWASRKCRLPIVASSALFALNLLSSICITSCTKKFVICLLHFDMLSTVISNMEKFAIMIGCFRFQFALTLLCHGRWVRASRILSQCIAMDKLEENAAVKHMLAAQIEIEHLGQYDEGC